MVDRHQELLDDPIMRRAIDELERRGFAVRGATAQETILRVRRILDANLGLAMAPKAKSHRVGSKD